MQVKGFSPVWVSLCVFRLLATVHMESHSLQLKGFSPVWVSLCVFRLLGTGHL